jgi:hypothetical protein
VTPQIIIKKADDSALEGRTKGSSLIDIRSHKSYILYIRQKQTLSKYPPEFMTDIMLPAAILLLRQDKD